MEPPSEIESERGDSGRWMFRSPKKVDALSHGACMAFVTVRLVPRPFYRTRGFHFMSLGMYSIPPI